MSLDFLSVDPAGPAVARSPMLAAAVSAGARLEVRGGWSVVTDFGSVEAELDSASRTVAFADLSHVGKLEARVPAEARSRMAVEPVPGRAAYADGACWCPITAERMLVLGNVALVRELLAGDAVDVTTALAALCIVGPLAREAIARFCAIDLRDGAMPPRGFRPGSIAGTPGYVLRTDTDRFLLLFGSALGEYLWTVVADSVHHLGGRPAGVDAVRADEPAHA